MKGVLKQVVDQSAHFALAVATIAIAITAGADINIQAGALIGFALGLTREATEPDPITTPFSLLDILFWTLGGAFAGAVL